jgi:hypothetical protein
MTDLDTRSAPRQVGRATTGRSLPVPSDISGNHAAAEAANFRGSNTRLAEHRQLLSELAGNEKKSKVLRWRLTRDGGGDRS